MSQVVTLKSGITCFDTLTKAAARVGAPVPTRNGSWVNACTASPSVYMRIDVATGDVRVDGDYLRSPARKAAYDALMSAYQLERSLTALEAAGYTVESIVYLDNGATDVRVFVPDSEGVIA